MQSLNNTINLILKDNVFNYKILQYFNTKLYVAFYLKQEKYNLELFTDPVGH